MLENICHSSRVCNVIKGSKAYLAERYIGFVKTKLSQALESREQETKNWIQFVQPLVTEYNRQKIDGYCMVNVILSANDNIAHPYNSQVG